jgi:hypothetical protein
MVGLGLRFLLEYLNGRVHGIQGVEDFVDVKVPATVARMSRRRWRRAGRYERERIAAAACSRGGVTGALFRLAGSAGFA